MRFREICRFVKQGFWAFVEDNALSHGASIAFYVFTGFLPALVTGIMLLRALFGHTMIRAYVAQALHLLMAIRDNSSSVSRRRPPRAAHSACRPRS